MDLENIKDQIVIIRGQQTILDSDAAMLYSVETKRVNEAVKNQGRGVHLKYSPKAFTEKALYMIETILKSPKATKTTISIIETFAKVRELSRNISE